MIEAVGVGSCNVRGFPLPHDRKPVPRVFAWCMHERGQIPGIVKNVSLIVMGKR